MFPGSSTVLGSHQCSVLQGGDHWRCVADVCSVCGGYRLGPITKGSVASASALSLPLGSFPWLCLLGGGPCFKTNSGEVVVNPTLCARFAIDRACFPGVGSPHQKQVPGSRF